MDPKETIVKYDLQLIKKTVLMFTLHLQLSTKSNPVPKFR